MRTQRAELKRSVSCNDSDQLYPGKASRQQLPTCLMIHKSASNLHIGTCKTEGAELLRCRSDGSESSNTQSVLTSMSRWIRGRASSAPERRASDVYDKGDAPQFDSLHNVNQDKSAEEVKRRWRSQQIAIQQRHAQAQRPWWSGWLQRNRCALNIAHRQK